MADNGQVIIVSLAKARKKRKQDIAKEKYEEPNEEKQGRILRFKQEEIGEKFVELGNGKVMKLSVLGRVISRGDKTGVMTIDALSIAKDENSKANDVQRVVPSPSA